MTKRNKYKFGLKYFGRKLLHFQSKQHYFKYLPFNLVFPS